MSFEKVLRDGKTVAGVVNSNQHWNVMAVSRLPLRNDKWRMRLCSSQMTMRSDCLRWGSDYTGEPELVTYFSIETQQGIHKFLNPLVTKSIVLGARYPERHIIETFKEESYLRNYTESPCHIGWTLFMDATW